MKTVIDQHGNELYFERLKDNEVRGKNCPPYRVWLLSPRPDLNPTSIQPIRQDIGHLQVSDYPSEIVKPA